MKEQDPVDVFVAVPLSRWQALEEKAKTPTIAPVQEQKEEVGEEKQSSKVEPVTVAEQEKVLGEVPASVKKEEVPLYKDLSKKYKSRHFLKLLEDVQAREEFAKFPNLEELVQNAISYSRKSVAGEEDFYRRIFSSNLARLVANPYKVEKYFIKDWWRI